MPPGVDRRAAARLGLVDPLFPDVSRDLERVFYLNFRVNSRAPLLLADDELPLAADGTLERYDTLDAGHFGGFLRATGFE